MLGQAILAIPGTLLLEIIKELIIKSDCPIMETAIQINFPGLEIGSLLTRKAATLLRWQRIG
jgi:hypothetical protein